MAVVEGTGDHGCEYMTGGVAVVIGPTGRNFAAGMSGGVGVRLRRGAATSRSAATSEMVDLEPLDEPDDLELVRDLLIQHAGYTGSAVADAAPRTTGTGRSSKFVKVMPVDYRRVLEEQKIGRADRARLTTCDRQAEMEVSRG